MARLAGADARNLQRKISRRGSECSVGSDLITGAFHLCYSWTRTRPRGGWIKADYVSDFIRSRPREKSLVLANW
jgi:hypothetical protein